MNNSAGNITRRNFVAAASVAAAAAATASTRAYAEEAGVKLGQVAQPLRAALTGRTTSPGLFDVMAVLGRDICLARLDAAMQQRADSPSLNPA